ncbi:hypothetical protein ABEB36_002646 [Hypothenemus hampei]|uniref:Uncharacterized protein n=1 Tax=Hypothenemus hampei TaxID=57062 RepID=A0ABD1F6X8_HYPHA
MSLKFKLSKNGENLKEINLNTSIEDFKKYRETLKVFQKNVNLYLTDLVVAETEEITVKSDSSESDSEEENCPKRSLSEEETLQKTKLQKN